MLPSARLPPFPQLYRAYFDDVWVAMLRLGVAPAVLEDAVHDVFVVVHRRTDEFEGRSTVRTWLLGIARRIAHRYRRTADRTARRHQALAQVEPTPMSLDEHIARKEGWRALTAFLDQLDDDKRDAFVLGELEQLGRRELGAALGVSPNTAYSRLRAARVRFSETFAPGPGPHAALAAGRHESRAPAGARQRVWLVLSPGLVPKALAGAWAAKVAVTTAALALGGLAAVTIGARGLAGSARADASSETVARTETVAGGKHGRTRPSVSSSFGAVSPGAVPPGAVSPGAVPPGAVPPGAVPPGAVSPVAVPPGTVPPVSPGAVSPGVVSPGAVSPGAVSPGARSLSRSTLDARRSSGAGATPRTEPSSPVRPDPLLEETLLLQQARAALASAEPQRALELLRRHRTHFPAGALVEEREAASIRARCALGQHQRAQHDAERFARAYPRSAYLEDLDPACTPR